ncbi:hypothetical protein J22TS3_04710 [Paenibacillus sp. J22TS3]|nr:hypothetical protein J22TS3_04710 [Paenibacillus sp. J22TS3]
MKLVIIFGPQAVGKMTVGHELEKMTNLKLFHNHMTIEWLAPLFGFSHDMWRLVNKFRQDIFEVAAASDMYGDDLNTNQQKGMLLVLNRTYYVRWSSIA